jgi:L-arabinose isomerase
MKKNWIVVFTLFISLFAYSKTGDWVAKVNGKDISQKEFSSIFNTQLDVMEVMSNNQMDTSHMRNNKQYQLKFLDNYVATQLMLEKIKGLNKRKKFVNERELKNLAEKVANFVEDQLFIKSYVEKEIMPKIGKISDEEVEQVYNRYKDKFKNVSATKAAEVIREKLKQQKAMMKLGELQERVKNEASIKINYEIFEQE